MSDPVEITVLSERRVEVKVNGMDPMTMRFQSGMTEDEMRKAAMDRFVSQFYDTGTNVVVHKPGDVVIDVPVAGASLLLKPTGG